MTWKDFTLRCKVLLAHHQQAAIASSIVHTMLAKPFFRQWMEDGWVMTETLHFTSTSTVTAVWVIHRTVTKECFTTQREKHSVTLPPVRWTASLTASHVLQDIMWDQPPVAFIPEQHKLLYNNHEYKGIS